MPNQNKEHWITQEQLDTPLCNIFPNVKTRGTARIYVTMACLTLGQKPKDLSKLSYTELNEYMDELEQKIDAL